MIGKLFNQWFLRKWIWAFENRDASNSKIAREVLTSVGSSYLSGYPMRFNIYRANGGMVVQVIQDSDRIEREQTNLYIFNDNDNIGEELNKIIIMESLKKP